METPENSDKQTRTSGYGPGSFMVLGVALEMGFIIALPIVILAAAGKWLDARHHTQVWIYVGIVLALASSVTWLFQRFEAMVKTLKAASESIKSTPPQEKK